MTRRKLPRLYEFDPGRRISKIVLAGAGGTGAQIARMLARLLYDMQTKRLDTPDMEIYDPDLVEEHNIGRQLFTAGDIGHNKAEVIAGRLNVALGLDITAVARPIDKTNIKHILMSTAYSPPQTLIIGAVDNAEARAAIASQAEHCIAWIDCGNHEHGGQVVIGNCTDRSYLAYKPNDVHQYKRLPAPHILFPGLLEPDPEPLSCAELAAQNRQALFVNDWMAMAAMNYVQKLLMREPVTNFITYVDTIGGNVRSVTLTRRNLRNALHNALMPPN